MLWKEKRNKKFWTFCKIHFIKTVETCSASCNKNSANKKFKPQKKTKRNRLILFIKLHYLGQEKSNFIKVKKLVVFQIISLRWKKSLTSFY